MDTGIQLDETNQLSDDAGGVHLCVPRRKAIRVSEEGPVRTRSLREGTDLPWLIEPAVKGVNLRAWAAKHRTLIKTLLLKHGALLFRDFEISTAEDFEELIVEICGPLLEYRERSSPRSFVSGHIYTSTEHPSEQSIFLHNENSYQHRWPMNIFFFAQQPSEQGGETPIADCRRVLRRISTSLREAFARKGWMYVRNFGDGFGLDWRTVFQTSDRAEVEAYCQSVGIRCEWKEGGRLRTYAVRPAIAIHPRTREAVWFNHATFFHVTTLEPELRAALLREFDKRDLPTNTYYGDGSAIEDESLEELRSAYRHEQVSFAWQKGDVLMLDNMLTAHGRSPYVGPRRVLVGMSEPMSWDEVQHEVMEK